MRRVLLLLLAAGLLGAGSASATCVGTKNTATACAENATIFDDCVYLAEDSCTQVTVEGPACVYGWVFSGPVYYTESCD